LTTDPQLVIGYNDPEHAAKVLEALSERSRLAVLGILLGHPNGITASEIAEKVDKKIPTILYHLEILSQAGLVITELKQRIDGVGRPVKHWKVEKTAIRVEIDIPSLILFSEPLSSYIEELREMYKKQNRKFVFGSPIKDEDILASRSGLTSSQAKLIANKITTDRILDNCVGFMIREFESDSQIRPKLSGISYRCAIDEELAQQVFYRLLATGKFQVEDERLRLK